MRQCRSDPCRAGLMSVDAFVEYRPLRGGMPLNVLAAFSMKNKSQPADCRIMNFT